MRPTKTLGLLERVRRLFADRRARGGVRVGATRIPLAERDISISGARFSLVGLAELRAQLGDRWPELSTRVHELAEAVIQRHLTRGDVFDRHGEDGYVILFTQLSQLQAEFKCRVIAKEIAGKLLGADWVGRTAEGDVVFELPEAALGAPSFEKALDEAIARGRPVAEAVTAPVVAPSAKPAAAGPAPQAPAIGPSITGREAQEDARPRAPAHVLKPIERERGSVAYTPIWEFGAEALLRFRLAPPPIPADAGASEIAKADLDALAKALFDVGRLAAVGRRLPVICPMRLDTVLRDVWRTQIGRILRDAPPGARKLVTLEVVVAAADGDWIGSLERAWASMSGALQASVPLKASAVPARRSERVRCLTLALADDFAATKAGFGLLGAFVQKAERAGYACGVSGLRTRAAVLAATAAGFRQLSGPAIHRDVAALGQATHFDLKSLYRDLLPQAV
jgi:hypothetical protein